MMKLHFNIEGIAKECIGSELINLKKIYFEVFPDGKDRESLPEITYFKVEPKWIRYSDYYGKPTIIEMNF